MSSAYLRLLIFLPAILIPACASSSPEFLMMCSVHRLNKQGDSRQPYCTPFSLASFTFDPWVGKIPWRSKWQPTPVLFPEKFHGWRSLIGFSPWGREESDTNERLHIFFSLSCIGEGNGNPLQCSCLENTRDSTVWWAAVYGVAQSRTRLMRLSSSSNSTESQRTAQNSPSQVSTECEP